ncbi:hypothetical protein M8J77_014568 [Diaphorina citri]|nr:hypothetical protein M8J77_014568 [Diaphorina citri]
MINHALQNDEPWLTQPNRSVGINIFDGNMILESGKLSKQHLNRTEGAVPIIKMASHDHSGNLNTKYNMPSFNSNESISEDPFTLITNNSILLSMARNEQQDQTDSDESGSETSSKQGVLIWEVPDSHEMEENRNEIRENNKTDKKEIMPVTNGDQDGHAFEVHEVLNEHLVNFDHQDGVNDEFSSSKVIEEKYDEPYKNNETDKEEFGQDEHPSNQEVLKFEVLNEHLVNFDHQDGVNDEFSSSKVIEEKYDEPYKNNETDKEEFGQDEHPSNQEVLNELIKAFDESPDISESNQDEEILMKYFEDDQETIQTVGEGPEPHLPISSGIEVFSVQFPSISTHFVGDYSDDKREKEYLEKLKKDIEKKSTGAMLGMSKYFVDILSLHKYLRYFNRKELFKH